MNRAEIATEHDHADAVAAAVTPDHTPEVTTEVAGNRVITTIERDDLGGLRATIDDYLRGVRVADETARLVSEQTDEQS